MPHYVSLPHEATTGTGMFPFGKGLLCPSGLRPLDARRGVHTPNNPATCRLAGRLSSHDQRLQPCMCACLYARRAGFGRASTRETGGTSWQRTMRNGFDVAYPRQARKSSFGVYSKTACLRVREAVVLAFALEARAAPRLAVVNAPEERGKGKGNAWGYMLKRLQVYAAKFGVGAFPEGKGFVLIAPGRRRMRHFIAVPAPPDPTVVHGAARVKRLPQNSFPGGCGIHSVLDGAKLHTRV